MARKKKAKKKTATKAKIEPPLTPPKVVPMPTAGPKITEFEAALDAKLAEAEVGSKRGPGRPAKPREPEPPQFELEVVKNALAMPFDLWASRVKVPALKLTENEAEQLARPVKELLDYYLPMIPPIAWAWITVSITSYNVMKIRLELLAAIREERKARQSGAEARGSQSPQGQGRPPSPVVTSFPSRDQIKPEKIEG